MLEICIISVRSELTKTLLPLLIDDVSIYKKLSPIGGKLVAPVLPVGELFLFT